MTLSEEIIKKLTEKRSIIIGRPGKVYCDVEIDDITVSRPHCKIEITDDNKILLTDINSKNHTYINGNPLINDSLIINDTDFISIGNKVFSLSRQNSTKEIAITAIDISKSFSSKKVALNTISFSIFKGDFIAILGPSGCGKSVMLRVLNGFGPASSGKVEFYGKDLYKDYESLKALIGYVPQDDIVHSELTVKEALYFAYQLRSQGNVNDDTVYKKIDDVLSELNLSPAVILNQKVGSLSGGQRKRISIAIELLSDPKVLYLDEPTSPLDPETIEEFLGSIKKLTQKGTTIIMVTHKPEDLNFVDRVMWLGTGGYLAYYGNKDKFLEYFNKDNSINIYTELNKSENAREWYKKWFSNYHKKTEKQATITEVKSNYPFFRQIFWLMYRYYKIKINDKGYMSLILAQAPIIACLIILIFDKLTLSVLFMINLTAIWLGSSNSVREIVAELPIYHRERMYNLQLFPYVISKLLVQILFSVIQSFIFVGVLYLFYSNSSVHLEHFFLLTGMMILVSISAVLMGLLLSALVKTSEQAIALLPLLLIPQLILSGVIYPINHNKLIEILSCFSLGRLGTSVFTCLQDKIEYAVAVFNQKGFMSTKYEVFDAANALNLPLTLGLDPKNPTVNIMMLLLLCVFFILGTVLALKKKDTL
ncbi:MAG: ATP-binding cassette domain-containing protein [Chitinophagales bacterium]